MSFSNLFTKLSDVEEKQPSQRNDINVEQRSNVNVTRKRKPQQQPGSYVKRLRSFAADSSAVSPEEWPRASDARRHWTRSSRDPRPDVSEAQAYYHTARAFRGKGNYRGNTNNANDQKRQNQRNYQQQNGQRFRNTYRERRGYNADFTQQPRQQYMTQEFKDQHALEVEGRLLCKFFLLGRCTKGEECQLQHSEGCNDMIKSVCKFYIQETCNKGATCPYMHQSFPCKFFHTKKCNSDSCRFSHDPLTDLTKKLLDDAIQRENELAEQCRKAEEPVCQTANEERNTVKDIVIPAVRPSFYQSSKPAAEQEPLPPHNEPPSDNTEEHSAPQTDDNTEPEKSATLEQPETVCYSVEAVLGPQLFKPVLYTATANKPAVCRPKTTKETFIPVNAPYSVTNILRSQSRYTSHPYAPASTSCELKEIPVRTTGDRHKVSHQNLFKQPHDNLLKAPGNRDAKETLESAIVSANLTPVAEQITADCKREHRLGSSSSQKHQTPRECDKLDKCGQDSELSTSSVSNSVPTKQETAGERSMKEHETENVAGKRQDGAPRERSAPGFSRLFGNLESKSDLTSSTCSFSEKAHLGDVKRERKIKPSEFTKTGNKSTNSSCSSLKDGLSECAGASRDHSHKPVAFSSNTQHKKEDKASSNSFKSLFTNLSSNVDQTFADTFSGKAVKSSAKELQKSTCERQKKTKSCQFMDNKQKNKKTTSPETLDSNIQRPLHKTDCFQSTKTPPKSFQSLFANLSPNSEATSACKSFSDKPAVPSAQHVEKVNCGFNRATNAEQLSRSKPKRIAADSDIQEAGLIRTNIEISNDSCLKSVAFSVKPSSKNKLDADIGKPVMSVKSFQNLFAVSPNESTVENDSDMQKEEQSVVCVKTINEEAKHEPKEKTSASPQRQPCTGPAFKTLFQQLRPFEQD